MNLQLIASVPSKRFDASRVLCADGRGGWEFSQVNVDRSISDYRDYWLVFGLGVLVRDATREDYVEATRLTARMADAVIGTDELTWRHPNSMWGFEGGDTIFEWAQLITLQPKRDGLIVVDVEAKLHSQPDWLRVHGHAYCRITKVAETDVEDRFVSSLSFTLRNLFRKPVWPAGRG